MKMRENKKGFSLVELIIVMAIMVALIAVLAPQFVKYVQRARDSSVTDAAQNVYEMIKSEYALGNISGEGTVTVKAGNPAAAITVTNEGLTVNATGDYTDWDSFVDYCGVEDKAVQSDLEYTITIATDDNGYPTFSME